jgi:transcriptional regulator with XRE-family HTH domain
MTQNEIADALGLSLRGYQNYERDSRAPSDDLIRAAWSTFGVDPVWLLTGEGSIQRDTAPVAADVPAPLARHEQRIRALLGVLADLDDDSRAAVLSECFTRAETAKQLAELRQAVQVLEAKQPTKRGGQTG